MKQVFEAILGIRTRVGNLLHYQASNSHNKVEYHFHGPVNFFGKPAKRKNISLPSQTKKN